MPLTLLPMEEEDTTSFGIVDQEAMKGWRFAEAMQCLEPDRPRRDFAAEWARKDWGKDPSQHWLKVTDTETGEMAAAALWSDHLEEPKTKDVPPPGDVQIEEAAVQEASKTDDPKKSFFETLGRMGKEFKNEFVGTRPYIWLDLLATHPKYQRRGAGSMLVKWGCDRADEYSVISGLQASKVGLQVYTKHGFEVKKTVEFDLKPYGVDDVEIRRGMIRQPKSKGPHESEK